MNIKEGINARISRLSVMMIETKKRIKSLPEGRINIKKRNQTVYYYKVVDHKERLLKRTEKKIAEDIIQKKYLKAVYKAAENESALLKEIQKRYPMTFRFSRL